ncbi:MAG: NF038122 family metalloprotease [Candidatus Udaeobacter sp.]
MARRCGQRFRILSSIVFLAGVALTVTALAGNVNLPDENIASHGSSPFEATTETHQTRGEWQGTVQLPSAEEVAAEDEAIASAPATRSTFMATWQSASGAIGYLLDVSTSDSFSSYVEGYHDLDVGNVTGRVVTGLTPGTTYYYRVRSYSSFGTDSYSEAMMATTVSTTGLIIQPTFDISITVQWNAAAIEAMINSAISIYESLFSDPITIQIYFRYATTGPDGSPLPAGIIAQSSSIFYPVPWSTFINALTADATTSNDNVANASLPRNPLSPNIGPHSANGRAVGLNTPPAMFANGSVGIGGPYDGIVTLNLAAPLQFTRPASAGNFDAQRATEHEMDEVMGFASHADVSNLRAQDLFSWSSAGHRNVSSSGRRYFSINGGVTNIVGFNQNPNGDLGDWASTACYQAYPYVQNAFACMGQASDVTATSPEGINLDVIGFDLVHVVVTTNAANNVASSSATLNGTVNPRGLTTTVHFEYGRTTNYGHSTTNRTYTGHATRPVSANITGLTSNTTYHFRLVASTGATTTFGSDRTFTTPSPVGAPVVVTSAAANIASVSATLNGSVYPHGLTTTVYFQYGTTTSYGLSTAPQNHSGNAYQKISANVGSLSPNTVYHFRIVATNSAGTRFSGDRTFTTLAPTGPPVVTTNAATNVVTYSATLNGSLDPHGLATTVYFQYGTTTSYGHSTAMQGQTGNQYRNIAANISSLASETTYHFRIVATNAAGTRFGNDRTFTTL